MDRIKWNFPDTYRKGYANVGDYLLVVNGEGAYQFGWKLQYKNEILLTSGENKCRSTSEAQRIVEAIFKIHKNSFKERIDRLMLETISLRGGISLALDELLKTDNNKNLCCLLGGLLEIK